GDGTFQTPSTVSTTPATVAVADFNRDGNLDLILSDDTGVRLLLGNGNGTFGPPILIFSTSGSLAIGDFNGDGNLDVAALGTASISVLLGNGNGTFRAAQSYAVGMHLQFVAAGDVNGDGHDDLVVSAEGTNYLYPGFVFVLLSNLDGTFQPAVAY